MFLGVPFLRHNNIHVQFLRRMFCMLLSICCWPQSSQSEVIIRGIILHVCTLSFPRACKTRLSAEGLAEVYPLSGTWRADLMHIFYDIKFHLRGLWRISSHYKSKGPKCKVQVKSRVFGGKGESLFDSVNIYWCWIENLSIDRGTQCKVRSAN